MNRLDPNRPTDQPAAGASTPDERKAPDHQVLNAEPDRPRALAAATPRDLETVCLKCLEKDPKKRYASAECLAADLTAYLDGRPISARHVGPAERAVKAVRRRPALASLVGLFVLAVAAGAFGVLYQFQKTKKALGEASTNAHNFRSASEEAGVALVKESQARASEKTARAAEKAATLKQARNLYTAHMNLIQRAWERSDILYVRELLAKHIPEDAAAPDFRGFEWYYYWRLTHAAAPVWTVAGDGDGWVAAGGGKYDEAELTLWARPAAGAAPSAHEPVAVVGHTGTVNAVAFAKGGARLVSASADRSLRVWDGKTGRAVGAFRGHTEDVWALTAREQDGTVLTGGADRAVFQWDLDEPQEYREVAVAGQIPLESRHLAGGEGRRGAEVPGEEVRAVAGPPRVYPH